MKWRPNWPKSMAHQRITEEDSIDPYLKPTRIKVKKAKAKKANGADQPKARGEVYHRERFNTKRALDMIDDEDYD